jgi:hypothetical protein
LVRRLQTAERRTLQRFPNCQMNRRIRNAFLALIFLQAVHSIEEFSFGFYEKFPPMKALYENAPQLAKPAFAISNFCLVLIGLACFSYWVRSARKGAHTVVWIWIILEAGNVLAHLVWASLIGGYNPGLVTTLIFLPVLGYLVYSMKFAPSAPLE